MTGLRAACLAMGAALAACAAFPPTVVSKPSLKKAIWGPSAVNGVSQFPIYRELGVGIFQFTVSWADTARARPSSPRDPADPAYNWPTELDRAIEQGRAHGISVLVLLNEAPPWANRGQPAHWAPSRPQDLADFAVAASRRYPGVRRWMVWGEPSKAARFQPLVPARGRHLSRRQRRGPRLYSRMLDATYVALKRRSRRNLVIGGNTWSGGEVVPLNFLKAMRLPNGRRPRMDLYGHNPFTLRRPKLSEGPIGYGHADFSELDALARWLDRYGYRDSRGRRLRMFLSEFTVPTDHPNFEFNFWVPRDTQAKWISAALRITRAWKRIYTFGYLGLYDDPPRTDGLEVNRGLIDRFGNRKPAYRAYRRG